MGEFGKDVGVTYNIIYRMTKEQVFSADLPLRYLIDIAEQLRLTVPDLLTNDPHPADRPDWGPVHPEDQPDDEDSHADMKRLAHYLLTHPSSPHPADLALAFEWTHGRLMRARCALNQTLTPLNLEVSTANDSFYVTLSGGERTRSDVLDDRSRVAIRATSRKRIDTALARALDDTLHHRLSTSRGNSEQVKLGQAVNLGLIGSAPGSHDYTATPSFLDAFPDQPTAYRDCEYPQQRASR